MNYVERVYTAFKEGPSQETLLRLYKVALRANKKLLVTWGNKEFDYVAMLDRPLRRVSYIRSRYFRSDIGFPEYPPAGTLYLTFGPNPGTQWTFDEISYKLEVSVEDA